jgi:Ca2+-binding RTX toxin-like protein
VQTNAPSGDTVTVTPVTMPTGMSFNNVNTFTWTPTTAQLNTSLPFDATVTDSQGRSATISTDITVVVGLAAVQVPVNETLGGNVTISFSNGSVLVFNNITDATLSDQTFKSTDTMEIDCPAGQSNSVTVMLPSSYTAAIPHEVYVNGTSGGLNNQVTVYGNAPTTNYFTVGSTVSANGLQVTSNNFQKLTLTGKAGDDDYELKSSSVPLWIVNTGNQGTLDFSQDTAGVTVNLGLDKSQAQYMSGWGTSLMLNGVLNEIIGTKYADTLHGGPAATTIIRSGAGNDMIVGGSGNNILVGGGGNDTITGGPNKNLLIAGSGTSTLNAGGSMNMAFGGSTNYDTNDQALLNLLNQGPNFMWGYSVRRAMASAAKNKALLANMLTLTDSGAHDVIFGSGPNNWFVPGKNGIVKR